MAEPLVGLRQRNLSPLRRGAFAGSVFAGEDSTHRMHCTGTTFYDNPAGMQAFDQSQAECGATLQAG